MMPELLNLLPQRRAVKPVEAEAAGESCDDLPGDLTPVRSQESFPEPRQQRAWVASGLFARSVLVLAGLVTVLSSLLMYGSGILLVRANHLGRQCLEVQPKAEHSSRKYRFAMVTSADGATAVPGRSFEGLMELATPNKQSYAKRHRYDFIDASDLIDRDRPPSWSKILAVRKHLPSYDWVLWNDADSIVTNPEIALEDIINFVARDTEFDNMQDFIVTEDVTGVNAGMFFLRNSNWSMHFLDLWWNQTTFVRPFGEQKSGDNDALKHLIKTMPKEERQQHVCIPHMQCIFNSNLWNPSLKSSYRLVTLTKTVWQGTYSRGDFMVHLAGLDDKKRWMKKILQDIEEERNMLKNPDGEISKSGRKRLLK